MYRTILAKATELRSTSLKLLVYEDKLDIGMKNFLARYSTDVIGSTVFGIECNSLKDPKAEFRRMGRLVSVQNVTLPAVEKFFLGIMGHSREMNNISRNDLIKIKNEQQHSNGNANGTCRHTCFSSVPLNRRQPL